MMKKLGAGWGSFRIIPVESGRGCPYGCEFCTVTGFFGDSIRFRTNESVVNELLLLKARAQAEGGQIAIFFIDDNFAINVKRTKSLLRDIITAGAQLNWVAQISANLLRDEELVDLISASRQMGVHRNGICRSGHLADVKKASTSQVNTPPSSNAWRSATSSPSRLSFSEWITIPWVQPSAHSSKSAPGRRVFPSFGLLTPLPATPLYKRLEVADG